MNWRVLNITCRYVIFGYYLEINRERYGYLARLTYSW